MKRELKDETRCVVVDGILCDCKAHPDEKGTERFQESSPCFRIRHNCKAHPDEKGTERTRILEHTQFIAYIARPIPMKRELKDNIRCRPSRCPKNCKAHPDEKGTESI